MERKIKLATLIQIESESLKAEPNMGHLTLAGQIALAEQITKDAVELAEIVLSEGVDMKRQEMKDQIVFLLADGAISFDAGTEAARALNKAARAALINPATTFHAEIADHCHDHIENILRLVS